MSVSPIIRSKEVTFNDSVDILEIPNRYTSSAIMTMAPKSFDQANEKIPPTWKENKKMVTSGEIRRNSSHSFVLFFESLPLWMIVLLPHEVNVLYVPSLDLLRSSIQTAGPLRSLLEDRLFTLKSRIQPLSSSSPISPSTIFLYVGSVKFINTWVSQYLSHPGLGIVDRHTKVRKSFPASPVRWKQIGHHFIGGGTNFSTIWFQFNFPPFKISRGLKRSISHYIQHGHRGKSVPAHLHPVSDTDSYLNLKDVGREFTYATPSSKSGFARRTLTSTELSDLFGYSSGASFTAASIENWAPVPKDMLRLLLDSTLQTLGAESIQRVSKAPVVAFTPSDPLASGTFLPSIQRTLPSSWAVDRHVDSSVKHDDAEANIGFWNKRISLIYKSDTHSEAVIHRALGLLRTATSLYVSRKIYREFLGFIKVHFSTQWRSYLEHRWSNYHVIHSTRKGNFCYIRAHTVPTMGGTTLFSARLPSSERRANYFYKWLCPLWSKFSAALPWDKVLIAGRRIVIAHAEPFACEDSYMLWGAGSTLIFWRWSPELQGVALLGNKPMISGTLPKYQGRKQRLDAETRKQVAKKLAKVIKRGYIKLVPREEIDSFMDFFPVPKGEDDIRMVYNGTTAGLTAALYAPRFWLPNADTLLRLLHFNFIMVDLDLGEMFLNFPLAEELQRVSGINLESVKRELCKELGIDDIPDELLGVWLRTWMGLKNSPVWAAFFYYLMEEFARGNEADLENPFGWDEVRFNIIGQDNFNPSLPNVIKWNTLKRRPAGDLVSYVDDLRALGFSLEEAWAIARAIASKVQYLGSQDAPRKRRIDMSGPWTGTIFDTRNGEISKTVAEKKWNKAKGYITTLQEILDKDANADLDYKLLEKIRGFMCHLGMTFPIIFPFLKGFHLVLSSHQRHRDEEGWMVTELEWIAMLEDQIDSGKISREDMNDKLHEDHPTPPKSVKATKRFMWCLEALEKLFAQEKPPKVIVRSQKYLLLLYGFVDASKSGFGATIDHGDKLTYRIGVWGKDLEDESSNWREFENLVETLEEEESKGTLDGAFVILATDNTTTEAAIFKGNSKSEKLYSLIVRFRALEMRVGATFLVTQVSGNRMMIQGTDGVSRGRMTEGVSIGKVMTDFCPWHRSPLEVHPPLLQTLKEWLGDKSILLEPKDWYCRAHDLVDGYKDHNGFWRWKTQKSTYIWNVAPGAANVAIEQLRRARIKRRESTHVFLVQSLCTTEWQRQLFREADLIFNVPVGADCWPTNCYEKLVVAIALPYLKYRPWRIRRTPKLCYLERELRRMFQKTDMASRDILCKFWSEIQKLYYMQEHVVLNMLYLTNENQVSCEET